MDKSVLRFCFENMLRSSAFWTFFAKRFVLFLILLTALGFEFGFFGPTGTAACTSPCLLNKFYNTQTGIEHILNLPAAIRARNPS